MGSNSSIGSAQAASILGISRTHLQRLASAGVVPTVAKLPGPVGAYVYDRAEVEEYAKSRTPAVSHG